MGTQARILYQDALGRLEIALKFNEMVRKGEIGPVMLGRDHHDTGGTDSPFREHLTLRMVVMLWQIWLLSVLLEMQRGV